MYFNLKALFDDETRKQIREAVLGEAKNLARSEIEGAVSAEVKRIAADLAKSFGVDNWRTKGLIGQIVREVLTTNWEKVSQLVSEVVLQKMEESMMGVAVGAVEKQATKVVAQKLRDKTVWEAEKQDDYVRKVVRSELARILDPTLIRGG